MTWARVDDGFHAHPKVRRVSYAAAGVFAIALSYAANYETDGLLDEEFVKSLRQKSGGRAAVRELVEAGMFETNEDRTVTIHDFLDFNPSHEELEDQRERNRRKQQAHRARGKQAIIPWENQGAEDDAVTGVVTPPPDAGLGGGETATTAENGSELHALVDQVLDKLRECPRFTVNDLTTRIGVENAMQAEPDADPLKAAAEAVVWASDPAYRNTNPAGVLLAAMRKQPRSEAAPGASEAEQRYGPAVNCHDCGRPRTPENTSEFHDSRRCDTCYRALEERLTGETAA